MKKNITCIVCPKGCRMTIEKIDGEYKVEGNNCKRGIKYAIDELTEPKRMITTTVKLDGSYLNMLPVKTSTAIRKELIFDVMNILADVTVEAPVKVGDVVVENILNTGIDIISGKNMNKIS